MSRGVLLLAHGTPDSLDEMPEFLGGAFSEVINVLDEQGLHPTGAPFGRYSMPEGGAFDAEIGFPCNDVVKPEGRVEACDLPGGRVARTMHVGPYGDVGAAYEAAIAWLTDEGYVGDDVHRAARIAAVGHGGQVLVSQATADLVRDAGPLLRDLGERLERSQRDARVLGGR